MRGKKTASVLCDYAGMAGYIYYCHRMVMINFRVDFSNLHLDLPDKDLKKRMNHLGSRRIYFRNIPGYITFNHYGSDLYKVLCRTWTRIFYMRHLQNSCHSLLSHQRTCIKWLRNLLMWCNSIFQECATHILIYIVPKYVTSPGILFQNISPFYTPVAFCAYKLSIFSFIPWIQIFM